MTAVPSSLARSSTPPRTPRAVGAPDWRQLRLLSNDAVRRLLNTALSSRDTDPVQFALWTVALVGTAPTFYAFNQTLAYASLRRAPAAVVERVAMGDRLFFVIYAMLASALLAALTWEALFPDRTDQEIVGVLPVRPWTVAGARFGAAATMAIVYAIAINAPAAFLFAFISAVHPAVGPVPGVLAGHFVATLLGCLFVFFTLVAIRGVVALCAGPSAAAWLGTVLQVVTVVLLVVVLFFLPTVLSSLVRNALDGSSNTMLPPVWFASLYASIAGAGGDAFVSNGHVALMAALGAAVAATLVYLVPATWIGRRALESRPRERATLLTSLAGGVATLVLRHPGVRSIFMFAVASLARSPRHTMILATYFGLALATGFISVVAAGIREPISLAQPSSPLLSLPLVFTFFAIFGLRAAMTIPTDLDANWPFRLAQPSVAVSVTATEALLLMFGVVPVTVLALLTTLALWPATTAFAVVSFQLFSGIVLIECALWGWAQVPFACAHAPSSETVRWRWPLYVVALNLYAFRLADLQHVALRSAYGTAMYLVLAAVAVIGLRIARRRRLYRQPIQFEVVPADRFETLNLSEAVN